ncbi:MAG TPA: bifunctional aspartate transaminase/aspartate 4-decarboxylase [Alphaproteobacteria bacterium]|nr:bifunctional aspartate transaminase/aspartate 4-decarboxylase [Alphaproteobacteria bacterium]
MPDIRFRDYETLSPFEIKDELIRLARANSQKSAHMFLNAGRGNPNWIATTPREGFFLLGQFAMTESRRVMEQPGLGGMPAKPGIADRMVMWLDDHMHMPGAEFLAGMLLHVSQNFGFAPDDFVHELVDSIIGDNYPVPDRMLVHAEQVVRKYLDFAMASNKPPPGTFDLYAVEGGTAAMCYIFKALKANRILKQGDTIALGTPIFTPYLEMPELEDYALNVVTVNADQDNDFQFGNAEIAKLEDPKIKAFFVVNPGNPTSVALSPQTIASLVKLVNTKRPDLILLTDDVYGTFVPGFRSLMAELPHNTIGVYSFSKYFGCTGWRLGVIALHQDNILDKMLAKLPEAEKKALDRRYHTLTMEPRNIRMIDRFVADSRDVALNHTAGLSLPQQVMMTLFSLSELMDSAKDYQRRCIEIVKQRVTNCVHGMGIEVDRGPYFAAYYGEFDFEYWIRHHLGDELVDWMQKNIHPLDIVFRLAEDYGIVLLNGSGFKGPDWSCRVSFANLGDDSYEDIGRAIRSVARGYVQAFRVSKGLPPLAATERARVT